jgi:hypothetical protein
VQTSLERADEAAVRPYNTQSPDGMGYLVLDKDATFASQVTTANTIYEIRYDYDLNGQTITIPANCVLKFNGGSLKNGILIGLEQSQIISSSKCFDGVKLNGFNRVFYAKWFGDDLSKAFPYVHNCELHLDSITYTINNDVLIEMGTRVIGHNTTIISYNHIYLGWRVHITGIQFKSQGTDIECLTILGSKIWESRQHYTDYEDSKFLIIGIKIYNCIFQCSSSAIVFTSSKVDYGTDAHHFEGSGFSFHIYNNQFNKCGDDTIKITKPAGWYTAFEITENVASGAVTFLHVLTNSGAVSGINVCRNDIQLAQGVCAIKLEAANYVNIAYNRLWDYYEGVIQLSKLNCHINLQIPEKGDLLTQYISYFDKTYTEYVNNPNLQPDYSSVNTSSMLGTDFVGRLPEPTHEDDNGKYYKLIDFLTFPLGNYYITPPNVSYLIGEYKDIPQQVKGWLLNISRPTYRQVVLLLRPLGNVFGYSNAHPTQAMSFFTVINTQNSDYISQNLKVTKSIWAINCGSFASATLSNVFPGLVYYDTTFKSLVYADSNGNLKTADGNPAGAKRFGTFADKPSNVNIGFRYFCTDRQTTEGATDGMDIIYKGNNVWVDALGRVVS